MTIRDRAAYYLHTLKKIENDEIDYHEIHESLKQYFNDIIERENYRRGVISEIEAEIKALHQFQKGDYDYWDCKHDLDKAIRRLKQ